MTIGSLFSGIGGLELGLESLGLGPVVWQCDSDPCARAVLEHHWPGVKRYEDVRSIDGTAERPDIICGGFPCQPHSYAGNRYGRVGTAGDWLGREFARVVGLLRPSWVFVENVPGLRTSGLRDLLSALALEGFDAEWTNLSACDAGAPHMRDRLFVLAHSNRNGEPALPVDAQAPRVPADAGRLWNGREAGGDVLGMADGVPAGMDRLRLLGNACVPQQAALAFKTLIARAAGEVQPR